MDDMFDSRSRDAFIGKLGVDIAGDEADEEEEEVKFAKAIDMDQSSDTMNELVKRSEERRVGKECW